MAASIKGMLPPDLQKLIASSKVLVVGAGGIGCELLKNLALTGFADIHIIDLDTIDVSNLNRQFLFRREHVGQPKAIVARESALNFNPNISITADHDSITEAKYDTAFFKQFAMVMNALDNRSARSHVNRMCLAANIPLVESGSAGYNGQVALHKKGVSECFDCTERPHQKTFPGCTIRNTPSEPIHCIVWAKHLFNQLFGVMDPDEDVSPDSADPEAVGTTGQRALELAESESNGNSRQNISTRQWAQDINYEAKKLFSKFFNEDIKYLLSMENLWAKRRPPTPLDLNNLSTTVSANSSIPNQGLQDQRIWSVLECFQVFQKCCALLSERLATSSEPLIWDKDDDVGMDFVTACASIRCHIFGLEQKSRFDTKSMAGNIIPAIASTNAIVAGLIVTTAFNVLMGQYHKCHTIYVSNRVTARKELFAVDKIVAPNPKCYVCAEKPEIALKVDVSKMTVRTLGERVLKKELNMVAPDVEIDDGQGTILISSEEGETDDIADKFLQEFKIKEGTRLKCDDFLQNYNLNITIYEMKTDENDRDKAGELFEIVGDRSKLVPTEMKETPVSATNGNGSAAQPGPSKPSTEKYATVIDDDDLQIIDEVEPMNISPDKSNAAPSKRPAPGAHTIVLPAKKRKVQFNNQEEDTTPVPVSSIPVVDLE